MNKAGFTNKWVYPLVLRIRRHRTRYILNHLSRHQLQDIGIAGADEINSVVNRIH